MNPKTLSKEIPAGIAGTAETIRAMHALVKSGVEDPRVAAVASGVLNGSVARRDYRGEAQALLSHVQQNYRYTRDPWTSAGLDRVSHAVVTMRRGGEDCIPGRTLVLTGDYALKPLAEVCVGEKVIARDGAVATVTQKWDKGMKKCLFFVLNNGSVLAATPDHKMLVVDKHGSVTEKRAGDLRVRDALLKGKTRIAPVRQDDQDRLDDFKFMGYYAADGWVNVEEGSPDRIGIAGKDGGPKEAQKEWVISLCQRRGWKYYRNARYVTISDGRAVAMVKEHCGRLARGKRIPLSPDMSFGEAQALYEGLMADSGVHKGCRCYSTCSPLLAVQARVLMHMLGFECFIRKVVNHGGFGLDPIYRVHERKKRRPPLFIKEIHDGNVEHVFDIETTAGSFYLPEHDAVVHNCDGLSVLLASLASSVGFPYAFRTVGTDRSKPDEFSHVYVMLHVADRGWIPADPSFEQPLGWEPAQNGTLALPDGTTVAAAEVVRDWLP